MEIISFQCASCGKALKVKEDKAGMKTKCPQCGTPLTVPKASSNGSQKPAPEPPKTASADEDDDSGAYGISETFDAPPVEEAKRKRVSDDDEDEEEEEEEKPKPKKKITRKKLKKRKVQFADQWQKVQVAVVMVFVGACIWGVNWLLHTIIVSMGILEAPQYATVVAKATNASGQLDRVALAAGLLSGVDHMDLGKTLFMVEQILNLVAAGIFLAAYCICLAVPPRYGTRGQSIALVCLGIANLLFDLLLKLLPAVGAIGYTMVPFLVPEIVMSEADIERTVPLHAFWCGSPFWEVFAAVLLQFLYFFEPILFCIFLRSVGLSLKDDEFLEPQSLAVIRLGFGQMFILIAFYMLSITGTSEVLHVVLLVAYAIWRGFFLGFIVNLASISFKARARIAYILDTGEEDEEDEYDDEDDED
jgi:DNA-directed RNA polymerase subunit RPC12/RpoP